MMIANEAEARRAEIAAEVLQAHKDSVNAIVSWKNGEITQDDAVKVEAVFRDCLARAMEPKEKRELRLIKDCEELTAELEDARAALRRAAQSVAGIDGIGHPADTLLYEDSDGNTHCVRPELAAAREVG